MEKIEIEEKIVAMLKTVYDPEIPVNVYDLGLIYKIDVSDNGEVVLDMTLTAPNCPAADFIMEDIRQKADWVELMSGNIVKLRLGDIDKLQKVFEKLKLDNILFEPGNIGIEMSLVY
jgi:metal-sulfur cluster biosynthetic enzyme